MGRGSGVDHERCRVAVVALEFGSLGREFGGHQPQSLGTGKVEAAPGYAEAVFGLATQELRGQHGGRAFPVVLILKKLNALAASLFRV